MPAAPPSWAASRSRRTRSSPATASSRATSQPGRLEPEGDRQGLLAQGPAGHDRVPVGPGQPGGGLGGALQVVQDRAEGPEATSELAVSMMSWLVAP